MGTEESTVWNLRCGKKGGSGEGGAIRIMSGVSRRQRWSIISDKLESQIELMTTRWLDLAAQNVYFWSTCVLLYNLFLFHFHINPVNHRRKPMVSGFLGRNPSKKSVFGSCPPLQSQEDFFAIYFFTYRQTHVMQLFQLGLVSEAV